MAKAGRHMTTQRFATELAQAGFVIEWLNERMFRAGQSGRSITVCFHANDRWCYAVGPSGRVRSMADVRRYLAGDGW